jgi:hypothetical protein
MGTGSIRNLIAARAVGVEPFARVLYRDPLDEASGPFARPRDRWRATVSRAAEAGSSLNGSDETDESGAGAVADPPRFAMTRSLFPRLVHGRGFTFTNREKPR